MSFTFGGLALPTRLRQNTCGRKGCPASQLSAVIRFTDANYPMTTMNLVSYDTEGKIYEISDEGCQTKYATLSERRPQQRLCQRLQGVSERISTRKVMTLPMGHRADSRSVRVRRVPVTSCGRRHAEVRSSGQPASRNRLEGDRNPQFPIQVCQARSHRPVSTNRSARLSARPTRISDPT